MYSIVQYEIIDERVQGRERGRRGRYGDEKITVREKRMTSTVVGGEEGNRNKFG